MNKSTSDLAGEELQNILSSMETQDLIDELCSRGINVTTTRNTENKPKEESGTESPEEENAGRF